MTVEELFDHFDYWDIYLWYTNNTTGESGQASFEDYEDLLVFLRQYGDYEVLYWSVRDGGSDFKIIIVKE